MAEELATVSTSDLPKLPKTGQIGFKEVMGMREPFVKRKAELQKGITAAEGDVAKATQAQSEVLQSGKMQAQKDFGAAQEGAMQGLQQKLEAEPLPAFIPTKDTAQDLAGLFSIVSVIGMIAGKSNGQQAMNAMNGMLEGYQKGRQDVYKKEAAEFDKNFKAMLSKHAEFRKEMEDAVKLAATNKEAGMQAAELAATKAGSSIVQAQLRKGDLLGAYKLVDESGKGAEKALTLESNVRQKAADRAAADERARLQRVQAKELAQIKADSSGGGGGSLPKDKETNNEHRFRYSAMQNVQDVIDELQKPEVRKLIGPQNQFTPDVLLNLQKGFPELAQKLARFQSEEFKIGGKSLTSTEQKILGPIYNWRGLTAGALESNLKEAERAMGKEQQYLENRYPGLKQFSYGQKTQYQLGQIIEQGGKKYRVTGVSDPSDPDVEEVK